MNRFVTFILAFSLGLAAFCVPLAAVDASSHHMMDNEVKFDCDPDKNSHFDCCLSDNSKGESFVFANKIDFETPKLSCKNIDSGWSVCFDSRFFYPTKADFYRNGPVEFLTGSTIKRE